MKMMEKIKLELEVDEEIYADFQMMLENITYVKEMEMEGLSVNRLFTNHMIRCLHQYEHWISDHKAKARTMRINPEKFSDHE